MKIYSENEQYKLYQGNMLDMLEVIEPNSIDSIVTDPPYGLTSITKRFGNTNSAECQYGRDGSFQRLSRGFMGKEWDGSGIEYNIETWKKCYEVLKEGGYLLAFGGSRTSHRIACAIEDAGFEIRDTIMWLYGSGFPKSMNIGLAIDKKNGIESNVIGERKEHDIRNNNYANNEVSDKTFIRQIKEATNEWKGWGTALKPSFEPIIVARKPFKGTLVDNIIENGVGGINIDECRVEYANKKDKEFHKKEIDRVLRVNTPFNNSWKNCSNLNNANPQNEQGRFPANTILTYDETDFDEVCRGFPNTKDYGGETKTTPKNDIRFNASKEVRITRYKESGSASRYFYCAKASKKDRDCNGTIKNIHPTCKPCNLMQYLVRLVTPNGGTILDPFNGSGSTGKAVMYENKERDKNYKYIGIELTEEYLPISKARIEYVCNLEDKKESQLTIFDLENNNE